MPGIDSGSQLTSKGKLPNTGSTLAQKSRIKKTAEFFQKSKQEH